MDMRDDELTKRNRLVQSDRRRDTAKRIGSGPITRRSFPREDAQGYVSARAKTYPYASSRGNASHGKDRRVVGPRPTDPAWSQ